MERRTRLSSVILLLVLGINCQLVAILALPKTVRGPAAVLQRFRVIVPNLRGGSAQEANSATVPGNGNLVQSWDSMRSWVSGKWDEIPAEEREKLQRFAVQMVDPNASLWAGTSPAVQIAMILLALKVATKLFPQWEELWRRLDGIVKDWQNKDPGPRAERILLETIELYFATKTGATLKIGSLRLPNRLSNVFEMRDVVIGNPDGFGGGEAVFVEQLRVETRVRVLDALRGRMPLVVVERLLVQGLRLSLRLAPVSALLGSEPKSNLEALARHLDSPRDAAPPQPRAAHSLPAAAAAAAAGKAGAAGAKLVVREMQTRNCSVGVGWARGGEAVRVVLGDLELHDVGEEAAGGVAPEDMLSAVLRALLREVHAGLRRRWPSGPASHAPDMLAALHAAAAAAVASPGQLLDAVKASAAKLSAAFNPHRLVPPKEGVAGVTVHQLLASLGLDSL